MDPITIGLALAQFAPSLIKLFSGSDKAADLAEHVVDVAKTITGAPDGERAIKALQQDPGRVLMFREAIGMQMVDLEKAYLADRADARDRDIEVRKLSGGNLRADLAVLAVVLGLVACLVVLVYFQDDIPGEVVGIISTIAGIFGACLKDYFSFEFGSSRGSKEKDELLSSLVK